MTHDWLDLDNPGTYLLDRRRRSLDLAHERVAPLSTIIECVVSSDLTLWVGTFERAIGVPKEFSLEGQIFRRLLDHFYIPAYVDPAFAVALFDQCAQSYERIVDVSRNVANIRNLLLVALASLRSGKKVVRVLDFGCGTGLSAVAVQSIEPNPNTVIVLTGVDAAPHMRDLAMKRGLSVLTKDELVRQPTEEYDVIFASYVAHLGISETDCSVLANKLATGGVFVANFHRGDEFEPEMMTFVSRLKAVGLIQLSTPDCDTGTRRNPTILFERTTIR